MKSPEPFEHVELTLGLLTRDRGLPAISVHEGGSLSESAAVCFAYRQHPCPVPLTVGGSYHGSVTLDYPVVTEQMRRGNGDLQNAAERGAYAVSFVLCLHLTGYTVVEQSFKGPGFDYMLGTSTDALPFQNAVRLEVTGICESDKEQVPRRVRVKRTQISKSDTSGLPGLIVVVDFRSARAQVEWR